MSVNRASEVWKEIKPFAIRDMNRMLDNKAGDSGDDLYAIILYDESAQKIKYYSMSGEGLAAALAAASSGDVVFVPAGTIVPGETGYSVGSEVGTGAITVTSDAGNTISDLTIGNLYALEVIGGPFFYETPPNPPDEQAYLFQVSDDGGSNWEGKLGYRYTEMGGVIDDTFYLDLPSWGAFAEAVDSYRARLYFIATTTSIKVRVFDTYWVDNGGSLSWKLSDAISNASLTVPVGVEVVGLVKNSVIDGGVTNSGKLTNLTVTGSISGSGENLFYDSSGLLITNKQIKSTLVTGTAPLIVASETVITNLNADMIDGHHYTELGLEGWFNVKDYGAVGDGTTDDTSSISDAITALDSAGGGILYFPLGTYLTSGGFTLANPTQVRGVGNFNWNSGVITASASLIYCNSATASLFTVTSDVVTFNDISLHNTAGSTPSAGAGITVTSGKADFYRITVSGFYIDIDTQQASHWLMDGCRLFKPVLYALKIRNTVNPDAGDWSISNSYFFGGAGYSPTAGIRIESSGGGKIVNCKINQLYGTGAFQHGIDVYASSVATGILQVTNCSIENVTGNGINIVSATGTSLWTQNIFTDLHIAIANTTGNAIKMVANAQGDLDNLIISNCILRAGSSASAQPAISLTNIVHGYIDGIININFASILSETNCSDITYAVNHDEVTVSDSSTVDFSLTDQEISADVIPGGIKLDDLGTPDDNTDLNASTARHGLLKKLSNVSTQFLNGVGNWSEPIGSGEILVADDTTPLEMLTNEAEDDYLFGG